MDAVDDFVKKTLSFIKFGDAKYDELLGIGLVVVALSLIAIFTVREAMATSKAQMDAAVGVRKVRSPIKSPKAASPAPTTSKSSNETVEEEESPEPAASGVTPKKRGAPKRRKAGEEDLGHMTSPEGVRHSSRLQSKPKTPKKGSDYY